MKKVKYALFGVFIIALLLTLPTGGMVMAADNVTITDNSTLEITIADNQTISATVNITGIDYPTEIDIGVDDLVTAVNDIWAGLITFLLVVTMLAIALIERYPGDYYLAGFTVLIYGLTQITTLEWLTTIFVLGSLLLFWKGARRSKELKA